MKVKGFTLIEIIIVIIILGAVLMLSYPNYTNSIQLSNSQAALNNLMAIYTAQLHYFNNNNSATYCLNITPAPSTCSASSANCGDSLPALNCNLNLEIADTAYTTYICKTLVTGFQCSASDGNLTIIINNNMPVSKTSYQLKSCASGANPCCSPGGISYCPTY